VLDRRDKIGSDRIDIFASIYRAKCREEFGGSSRVDGAKIVAIAILQTMNSRECKSPNLYDVSAIHHRYRYNREEDQIDCKDRVVHEERVEHRTSKSQNMEEEACARSAPKLVTAWYIIHTCVYAIQKR